jgi:hypothetical protein
MTVFRPLPLLAAFVALPLALARADDPPAGAPSAAERAECVRMVDELRADAARIRGLAWKEPVPADLISRKQLRASFLEDLDEDYPPAKRARDLAIMWRTRMMNRKEDPLEMEMSFLEIGVAGFYDPRKKYFRIVEGFVGDGQRPTILHELTHALEDQYFDLRGRVKPIEEDADRMFAEKCIEEGAAELARVRYEAEHPELKRVFAEAQNDPQMAAAQKKLLPTIPAFMWQSTLMQYSYGLRFVQRTVEGGTFAERMAALYKDPPVSQEQILHPDRWFRPARDYPQAVVWAANLAATAGEGWKLFHEFPSGELDLAFYLDFHLHGFRGRANQVTGVPPSPQAKRGAAGWDAAFSAFLRKPGQPLAMVQAYAFDTAKDAWEAAEMLGSVAKNAADTAWKGEAWVKGAAGADGVPATATLDYANQYGLGRLHLDGTHILGVDGVAPEVLTALWPVVVKTKFVRDARDTWVPGTPDPAWTAASYRNEEHGIAVSVPNTSWRAGRAMTSPSAFASVTHVQKRVGVTLIVIAEPASVDDTLAGLSEELKEIFPNMATEPAGPARISDSDGLRVVLGKRAGDGRFGELAVASDEDRVWVAITDAPDAASIDALRADIDKILASVVTRE